MAVFTAERDIRTAPETAFALLEDFARWHTWTASVESATPLVLKGSPIRKGVRVEIKQPAMEAQKWVITQWDPPKGFVWTAERPGLVMRAEHWIEGGAATCKLRLVFALEGPLALAAKMTAGGRIQSYLDMEANGLKRAAERAAA
jgi:hypothetical protein